MKPGEHNNLIHYRRILSIFLNSEKSIKSRLGISALVFLLIPLFLFAYSAIHSNLFFKEVDRVGFLDDYLFLFLVLFAPAQLFVFNVILYRFDRFLKNVYSFTKSSSSNEVDRIVDKHIGFVRRTWHWVTIVKIIVLFLALWSNTHSLYFRTGAWNSPDNHVAFIVTLIYLVPIIWLVLEIFSTFLHFVVTQIRLTSELNKNDLLFIKPLSLDKSGSLKSLGDLSLSFTYILVPSMIMLIAHYMTWSSYTITFGFIASIVSVFFLTLFLFFFPLGTVHNIMRVSKQCYLKELDKLYLKQTDILLDTIKTDKNNELVNLLSTKCENIKKLYATANEMPVWPFNMAILSKFLSIAFGPVAFILLELLFRRMFF